MQFPDRPRWAFQIVGLFSLGSMLLSTGACNRADRAGSTPPEPEAAILAAPLDEPPPGPIIVEEQKFENGNLKSRFEGYRDADGNLVRHGLSAVWYENGDKRSEQRFLHGEPHGPRDTWRTGGRPWTHGEYAEGIENGIWRNYYNDGTPQTEWVMDKGAWNGKYTEYHPNGKRRFEVEFVKGKRQGPSRLFDEQGVVMQEGDFVDGIEQP